VDTGSLFQIIHIDVPTRHRNTSTFLGMLCICLWDPSGENPRISLEQLIRRFEWFDGVSTASPGRLLQNSFDSELYFPRKSIRIVIPAKGKRSQWGRSNSTYGLSITAPGHRKHAFTGGTMSKFIRTMRPMGSHTAFASCLKCAQCVDQATHTRGESSLRILP